MVNQTLIAKRLAVLLLLINIANLAGCAAARPPLYSWGRYEDVVFETFLKPGEGPGNHAAQLREDIERANAEGQAVPPGMHAHLGYLYHLQGDEAAAKAEFELEKQRFPEAKVLMDRLIGKVAKRK